MYSNKVINRFLLKFFVKIFFFLKGLTEILKVGSKKMIPK